MENYCHPIQPSRRCLAGCPWNAHITVPQRCFLGRRLGRFNPNRLHNRHTPPILLPVMTIAAITLACQNLKRLASACRGHHFFVEISFKPSIASICSATIFSSRKFSASSSLSLCASDTDFVFPLKKLMSEGGTEAYVKTMP